MRSLCCLAPLLAACASGPPTPLQQIEVRVEAEDPDWRGPLDCSAENEFGRWPFTAPGMVIVPSASSPLQIRCESATGAGAPDVAASAASGGRTSHPEAGDEQGLGQAALSVGHVALSGGPPFAVVLVALGIHLQSVTRVGVASGPEIPRYPDTIVIRLLRPPPAPDAPAPPPASKPRARRTGRPAAAFSRSHARRGGAPRWGRADRWVGCRSRWRSAARRRSRSTPRTTPTAGTTATRPTPSRRARR